jgi:prepilin-type processing-associated H-X9-DG protein
MHRKLTVRSCRRKNCRGRGGFTLAEVQVAAGIMGLLIALLLPAVQSAREKARQLTCKNQLKHIGVALQAHQSAKGYFPRGGYMRFDGTARGGHARFHAPHIYLLPYLDQQNVYDQIDLRVRTGIGNLEVQKQPVTVFSCPSDSSPFAARNNYRANMGLSLFPQTDSALKQTPKFGDGAFAPAVNWLRPQNYTDGFSNTVGFSERITGDGVSSDYTPARDLFMVQAVAEPTMIFYRPDAPWRLIAACGSLNDPQPNHESNLGNTWFRASIHHTLYNHLLTPNHPIPDCGMDFQSFGFGLMTARSAHPGGVNCLMMDGAVRFVANGIDRKVWYAVGTRNGGEIETF